MVLNSPLPILNSRRLLLIRHARTVVQPGIEPSRWPLDNAAAESTHQLAERLAHYRPAALVTSREPKAVATGRVLGAHLALEPRVAAGLHEHERSAGDFVADRDAFERQIALLFQYPDQLMFGRETANQARSRFGAAVDGVLKKHPAGDVAIVAHGTVITLFVARFNAVDALAFWRGFGMPDCVVLEVPAFRIEVMSDVRSDE